MTQNPPALDVSVIIPVHGDAGRLQGTLDALLSQDYPDAIEVLVVDNGDNDASPVLGTDAAALPQREGLTIRVLHEPQPGSYAARNLGVRSSSGKVLAFTDADCLPRPDWLSAAVARLRAEPEPVFVGGRIALFREASGRPTAPELWELARGFRQDEFVSAQSFAATANLVVRRDTFLTIGPFSAGLLSGGDREWGVRASRSGVLPVYAADAVVDHPCRSTLGELRTKTLRVARGHGDVHRVQGRPDATRRELLVSLRPPLRSSLREARQLARQSRLDALRYLGVEGYVYALESGVRLRTAVRG